VGAGYCSLEIDLASGRRGQRGTHLERLLRELTGAEAALVVNNNAAATMLALRGLARGKEVIVSRGQLIEIGGSFRLPEVMVAGGATLREIGTTNKTHLRDYETAIGNETAMIMHVHTSNYRVVGFSESPDTKALSELAHRHGLLMFDDLGSGALLDDELWTAAGEPTVVESLRRGADVVSFSGDKLLGGPQAGILLGRREILDTLRRDPMARALRIDKLTIAALEAVLELYHEPERANREIPLLAALGESPASLKRRAEALVVLLRAAGPSGSFTVQEDESFAGGGSLPAWPMPTAVVRWQPGEGVSLDDLTRRLRLGEPSVLCRVHEGAVYFDLRTISERECDPLAAAISAALT
jgi:L-seryl-tRNA(Ser) seleniumtransferase